jgi:diguanylate cyclase (GGDEF)-like protein
MELRAYRRGLPARVWHAVSNIGVPPLRTHDHRTIVATNQFAVLASLGAVPYLGYFLAHWPQMRQPMLTTLLLVGWWGVTLLLNSRKQFLVASVVALFVFELQLANLTHWFTTESGFHYLLFAAGMMTFMLFRTSDWLMRATFVVVSVVLFLYCEAEWPPASRHHAFPSSAATILLVVNVLATVLLLYIVARFDMHYYERERRRNAELLDAAQVAAQTDALTDVFNRRGVAPVLSSVVRRGEYALALVDLDRFKLINDRLGHGAGDVVLSNAARTLVKSVGVDGVVARWGGEEFLVVIPGRSLEEADAVMERARADMEAEYGAPDSIARVTISIGLAHAPRFAGKEETLRLADANLYEAKSSGRNLVVSGRLTPVDRD